ncbi:MAG: hypothetical protein N3F05_02410 [Candidatus Diapherotrites archaeon]|nr:hypothetical protein [Candidatus Diapherotrites archaeon]
MSVSFLNFKIGQKGNILAFIVIAILSLVFILVLTRHEPLRIPKDINTETKVETITMENIVRSVRQSIQNFSKEGLSTQSSLWVCNIFMPPVANEIDTNGSFFISKELGGCLRRITEDLGYGYNTDFNVSLGLYDGNSMQEQLDKMMSLPNDRVDVNVSFVVAGAKIESGERRFSNNYALSYPYRTWHAYKKYLEWGQNYLSILGLDICEELRKAKGPCLFVGKADPTYHILTTDDYVRSKIDLNDVNIDNALNKQLDYLNQIMNPISFECEYEKISEKKDLAISRDQNCVTPRCSGIQIIEYDVPGACGTQEERHGTACPPREALGPWVAPPMGTVERNYTKSCTAGQCKIEIVGANPYVAFSVKFRCKDTTRSISMEQGVEPYTLQIGVYANIVRVCPPVSIPLEK